MLGLIIWAILIIVIAISVAPGFVTFFFFVALPIAVVLYVLLNKLLR